MTPTNITWARIMAPLAGTKGDPGVLNAAAVLAEAFSAELAAVFTPADVADLMPWMGDGFMGGVQVAAFESLREAGEEGRRAAQAVFSQCAYGRKTFISLNSPVWSALSMHSRLSDVVVFDVPCGFVRDWLAYRDRRALRSERRWRVLQAVLLALIAVGVLAVAWRAFSLGV